MITKEKISINYLFFKQPTNHIMVLGPLVIACATIFFSNSSFTLSESKWNDIYENQYNLIKDFLTIFKLTFVVLSSFYITYRWALFKKDGNLGYWLSQGVNKKKFFFLSFIYFYLNPLLGILLGLLIIIFSFGVIIPHTIILQLVLSVIVSYSLVIAVSIFTAEVIQNPEIALVSNIGIYLVMYIVENENFISGGKVFYPELEFFQSNYPIWIVASLITTVILLLTAFFVYLRRDIEL